MHPTAPPLVTFGIAAISLVMSALFVAASAAAARKLGQPAARVGLATALAVAAWLAVTGAIGASGLLQRWDLRPPPGLLMIVVVLGAGFGLGFSSVGKRLAGGLPLFVLVAAQGFRLPLELVMHEAAAAGTMPVQLSFSGYNFDIVTGCTALIVALLVHRGLAPRWLVFAWSAYGIACLVVIALIAFGSTPLVAAFGSEPERLNTWVTYFPFVWLPTVLVILAIAGHIVVLRRLAAEPRAGFSSSSAAGAR